MHACSRHIYACAYVCVFRGVSARMRMGSGNRGGGGGGGGRCACSDILHN